MARFDGWQNAGKKILVNIAMMVWKPCPVWEVNVLSDGY